MESIGAKVAGHGDFDGAGVIGEPVFVVMLRGGAEDLDERGARFHPQRPVGWHVEKLVDARAHQIDRGVEGLGSLAVEVDVEDILYRVRFKRRFDDRGQALPAFLVVADSVSVGIVPVHQREFRLRVLEDEVGQVGAREERAMIRHGNPLSGTAWARNVHGGGHVACGVQVPPPVLICPPELRIVIARIIDLIAIRELMIRATEVFTIVPIFVGDGEEVSDGHPRPVHNGGEVQ